MLAFESRRTAGTTAVEQRDREDFSAGDRRVESTRSVNVVFEIRLDKVCVAGK